VRTVAGLLTWLVLLAAGPAFGQTPTTTVGAGKLEVALIPGGWLSVSEPDVQPEPAFSQYLFGGSFTVNWSVIGLEGEFFLAPGRTQDLKYGSAPSVNQTTPGVFIDSVSAVFPLMGNRRKVIPYAASGIGEFTVMRTDDNVTQPDTETFTTGFFGGGVKWYSSGRWGVRGDYRFLVVRSKFASAGAFFGEELRKANRLYGALTVNLIR